MLDNDYQETFVSDIVLQKRKRDRVKENRDKTRGRMKQNREKVIKGKVSIMNRCTNKTKMDSVSTSKCSQMANLRRKRKLLEKLKRYCNNMISKRYQSRRVKTLADSTNIFNEKNIPWPYICMFCVPANMVPYISFKCSKYHLDIKYPEGNIYGVHTTL